MPGICKECGETCPDPKKNGAPRRYCSDDCRTEVRRRHDRNTRKQKKLTAPPRVGPLSQQQRAAVKRREIGRREGIDPTGTDPVYTDDETEFLLAVDRYKRESKRQFPTLRELLEVIRSLGWRKGAGDDAGR